MRSRIVLLVAALFAVLLPAGAAQADGVVNIIPRGQDAGRRTVTDIAADGNPIIAFSNESTQSIEVTTCFNPECTRATGSTIVSNSPGTGFDFAVGPDGLPVFVLARNAIAWGGGWVDVVKCTDIHCRRAKTWNQIWFSLFDGNAGQVSIDVGPNNNPTVVMNARSYGSTTWFTSIMSCGDAECSTSKFRPVGADRDHDIAIGPNGLPIIALGAVDEDTPMTVERCLDDRCEQRKAESVGKPGVVNPNIATDGRNVWVSAVNSDQQVVRAVCGTSRCGDMQVISTSRGEVFSTNVTTTSRGRSVISYTDSRQDLWLLDCTTRSCSSERLLRGQASSQVGLAYQDDLAFISFFAPRYGQIGYAIEAVR